MKKIKFISLFLFTCLFSFQFSLYALGSEEEEVSYEFWHDKFFDKLVDSMYCVSETTGKIEKYNETLEKYCQSLTKKIDKGFDPNEKNAQGKTPLMIAALEGYPQIIEKLLKIPKVLENINQRDNRGLNALDYAMQALELSKLFLNPSLKDNIFTFIPFVTLLTFYTYSDRDNYTPYNRSVYLLKTNGAEPCSLPLKDRMANYLNENIQSLTKLLSDPASDIDNEMINSSLDKAKINLNRLRNYQDSEDFGKFCLKYLEKDLLSDP